MHSNTSEEPNIVEILQDEVKALRNQLLKERELMDYSFLLQHIIDASPYPMWIANSQGVMQKANKALLKTLNLSESDLIGKYNVLEDQNLHKLNLIAEVERVFTDHKTATLVMPWNGGSSEIEHIDHANMVWIEASVFPILDDNNELTHAVCQWFDITKQKQAEFELEKQKQLLEELVLERTRELEQKNEQLQKTSQSLNEIQSQMMQSEKMASLGFLTASIAHDLSNPLNYIYSAYYYLQENLRTPERIKQEDVEKILGAMGEGLEHSTSIVKSLNQFSRTNVDMSEQFEVHDVLENCLVMLHSKLKYHINVVRNYQGREAIIKGNSGQLHQVFLNILTNSVQAITTDGGTITIGTGIKGKQITIAVTDDGCGISSENLAKITDPFFTTKAPGEGTGLGLAISNKIITEHNGTLKVDSRLGEGTTTLVSLWVV